VSLPTAAPSAVALTNEVSATQINNLLKPDDRQDVKLAYDLLSQIWALPSLDSEASARPGFIETREALCTLGKLFIDIILPYVCVELSLSEQLTLLSTAAHLLLAMVHEARLERSSCQHNFISTS